LLLLWPNTTYAFNLNDNNNEHSNIACSADDPYPVDKNTLVSNRKSYLILSFNGLLYGIKLTNLKQCNGVSKYLVISDGFIGFTYSNIGLYSLS